jgi:signal transduction histidine kinase
VSGPTAVRLRVTAVATVAVAAVLAIAGATLVLVQRAALVEDVDDVARAVAADVTTELASAQPPQTISVSGDDDTAVQVIADGVVVTSTVNVVGLPPLTASASGTSTVQEAPHADGRFRVLVGDIDTGLGPARLVVGVSLDDVDASIAALVRSLLLTAPVAVAALAVVVWWVVGRTLRPVEIANRRQERFIADASHELRAPLARMRSELEVDLAHPDTSDPWRTHRSVLDETERLQHLVDDLLQLARTDATGSRPATSVIDLDDLVLAEAERVRAAGRLRVDISGLSAAQLVGDSDALTRAVRNLADNAARHARTAVAFSVRESNGHAVLAVADDGPGIPPGEAERVFERFTRLDPARHSDGGAGLGLAIARDIVTSHGGTIVVDPEYDAGARLVVTLPTSAGQRGLQLQ